MDVRIVWQSDAVTQGDARIIKPIAAISTQASAVRIFICIIASGLFNGSPGFMLQGHQLTFIHLTLTEIAAAKWSQRLIRGLSAPRVTLNLQVFLQGLFAGYGIVIPVGPIAIFIIELGIRKGFSTAFCAGAGAASADLVYATLASLAGAFLVSILRPYSSFIHIVSALALIALGFWLLTRGRKNSGNTVDEFRVSSPSAAYFFVFGLTLLNPLTIAYFTTLILSFRSNISGSPENVVLFISGTFLASLSWQSIVAFVGGFGHERLSPRLRLATVAIGNSIIVLMGILLLMGFTI